MEKTIYIHIKEFCSHYNVEVPFIKQLQEYEVVNIEVAETEIMIPENELLNLEKMVRLHHDLAINPEGLQAIHHLLAKVNHLQEEINFLSRKLKRFED
ncbi:MerR family transcriptional regulator [Aurantibacter crassamenti]|uniref:chaperone modulator CbpM n=1 Tax=Aurantibacter crassamenti TaxID=1837375 RepID=UPI001939AEC7|nr:chaperone modulator CbpM [Aurantibacter crassamenti]MBM1106566.1 MerR family transcriptional regulator [Aurantibacter crassamenti]